MKRRLVMIGFCLIFCLPCGNTQADHTPSFKVMTWNIWHGGLHGDSTSQFMEDTSNTLNVLRVIQEEKPDILLMQETYCCGMDIAKQAGFEYSWRASSNLSIHSHYPIIDTFQIFKPFNSQAVTVGIEGKVILIINVWLHYLPDFFHDIISLSPDALIEGERLTRLFEIEAILAEVDDLQKELDVPVIIGGDFNSASHFDWIESTKKYHYNKVVEWPVSKAMQLGGFKDSFREMNPDPIETMEGTWGFLNDDIISDRIDYIYRRGAALQTLESKIVMKDPEGGFFNSDHRAISSTFRWKE